jgi:hypothetical protein
MASEKRPPDTRKPLAEGTLFVVKRDRAERLAPYKLPLRIEFRGVRAPAAGDNRRHVGRRLRRRVTSW